MTAGRVKHKSLPTIADLAQFLLYQAETAMLTGNLPDAHEMLREARAIPVVQDPGNGFLRLTETSGPCILLTNELNLIHW